MKVFHVEKNCALVDFHVVHVSVDSCIYGV
jgi:hypothetical protein